MSDSYYYSSKDCYYNQNRSSGKSQHSKKSMKSNSKNHHEDRGSYDNHKNNNRHRSSRKEPSQTIIFQGLAPITNEETLTSKLEKLDARFESIRFPRDRETGDVKGYAFAKFISIEHAKQFYDQNAPCIWLDDVEVKIDYSIGSGASVSAVTNNNNSRFEDGYWYCFECNGKNFIKREECYRCGAVKSEEVGSKNDGQFNDGHKANTSRVFINDGSRDMGDIPHTLLLVRGLDPLTNEDKIFHAFSELAAIKDIRLVKDKSTDESLGFAFVDCSDVQTSAYVLSLVLQFPEGFQIDRSFVAVSYAHINSFVASYESHPWASSTYYDIHGQLVYLTYWDEHSYTISYNPCIVLHQEKTTKENQRNQKFTEEVENGSEDGEIVENFVGHDLEGSKESVKDKKVPPPPPTSAMKLKQECHDVTKNEKSTTSTLIKNPFQSCSVISSAATNNTTKMALKNSLSSSEEYISIIESDKSKLKDGESTSHAGLTDGITAMSFMGMRELITKTVTNEPIKVPIGTKKGVQGKKIQIQLGKWQAKHAELRESEESEDKEDQHPSNLLDLSDNSEEVTLPTDEEINLDQSDFSILACLLCERQFKSIQHLEKHQIKSELHKKNLELLKSQLSEMQSKNQLKQQQQQYRNRAVERRNLLEATKSEKRDFSRMQQEDEGNDQESNMYSSEPQSSMNIGSKLMKLMGWKEGQGLGAQGTGIVNPVQAETYAPGVGLGASVKMTAEEIAATSKTSHNNNYTNHAKKITQFRY